MRIRFKPWARNELESSLFYINEPQKYKNRWNEAFEKEAPIYIELGCGKGEFISTQSYKNQYINYIGIDLVDAMLGLAKRNVEVKYNIRKSTDKEEIEDEISKQKIVKNLKLVRYDIMRISDIIGDEDRIDRIYINFCNPWPKEKHKRRRLTYPTQLLQYRKFLKGKIFFKTDDIDLFKDSIVYLEMSGFRVEKYTFNLESETNYWNGEENIETEHERIFKKEGKSINALVASIPSQNIN